MGTSWSSAASSTGTTRGQARGGAIYSRSANNTIAGGVSTDLAGVSNSGTNQNGPTLAPGMVAGALCFDGKSQAVIVPDQDEVDFLGSCGGSLPAESFTIDAGVKTPAPGLQILLDKRLSAPNVLRGYSLYIRDGRLGFQMATGIGNSNCGSTGSACTDFSRPRPRPAGSISPTTDGTSSR